MYAGKIVYHRRFEAAVIFAIVTSTLLILIPEPPPGRIQRIWSNYETAVTFLFTLEALLKFTSNGLAGYMASKTEMLDLVVAMLSLVDEVVS